MKATVRAAANNRTMGTLAAAMYRPVPIQKSIVDRIKMTVAGIRRRLTLAIVNIFSGTSTRSSAARAIGLRTVTR